MGVTELLQYRCELPLAVFQTMMDELPLSCLILRLEDFNDLGSLRFLYANKTSDDQTTMDGYLLSSVGYTMRERFPEFLNTPFPAGYRRVLQQQKKMHLGEYEYGDENIEHSIFSITAFPFDQQTVGVFFENITSQKKYEAEILTSEQKYRHSEKRYRSIFENTRDGINVLDLEGIVLECSPAACRLHGVERDELIGQPIDKILHPSCRGQFPQFVIQLKKFGQFQVESLDIRKDGSTFPVEVVGVPFFYQGQEAVLTLVRDLTESKLAEEKLHVQQQELEHISRLSAVGEMASNIAHELNQPLAAIAAYTHGCVELLRSRTLDVEAIISALRKVEKQTTRAADIIQYARNVVRKKSVERKSCDVNFLIHQVISYLEINLKKHKVKTLLSLSSNLPEIFVDQVQFQQLMMNIFSNALDAMKHLSAERHSLAIKTLKKGDDAVMIVVEDQGCGFDQQQVKQIQRPFFTTKERGLGMGLAICSSIVEAHGGHLNLTSQINVGTRVEVVLPIEQGNKNAR